MVLTSHNLPLARCFCNTTHSYIQDFSTLDSDLSQFVEMIAVEQDAAPLMFFSHSMGAMLVVRHLTGV